MGEDPISTKRKLHTAFIEKQLHRLISLRAAFLAIAQADDDEEGEFKRAGEGGAMENEDVCDARDRWPSGCSQSWASG
jgi:hypothetical protein